MTVTDQRSEMIRNIQRNCDISDARDHGIYSMCTMVLKLRNLYKWEKGLEPWQEPEAADLLDWIEMKENFWKTIAEKPYLQLGINGHSYLPDDATVINESLSDKQLVYGAGYGRSMKTLFFLADKIEQRDVAGYPVFILGKERAKEMASPFAMAQDGVIYIRRESLRFFLWDYIQELRSSCRSSFRHALKLYGLLEDDQIDQQKLKNNLDRMVDAEMDLFIYHEVGELAEKTLDSSILQAIVSRFPGSVYELVCRSIKDLLADTHPQGLLPFIIREQRESSLSFYVGFLDGLRKKLFPEIFDALEQFFEDGDWQKIEQARRRCRDNSLHYAEKIKAISENIGHAADNYVQDLFNRQVLQPLGLDLPK